MFALIEKSILEGEIEISGAKNAFFPAVAAGIALGAKIVKIKNVPRIKDVETMLKILENLGARIELNRQKKVDNSGEQDRINQQIDWEMGGNETNIIEIDLENLRPGRISSELFGRIRGAVLIFGAFLSRFGEAEIPMPGGCPIGDRPIDQHIKAARCLGLEVDHVGNRVRVKGKPKGGRIKFDVVTVTGTENAILMAVLSEKDVEIENPAQEPEVQELIKYIRKYGINAYWEETGKDRKIIICGRRSEVEEVEFELIPDRIEAGTWLIAACATGGNIKIKNVIPSHIGAVVQKIKEAGAEVRIGEKEIELCGKEKYYPVDIVANPYPEFPTDMQPQITVMLTRATGKSRIKDEIFPRRINHIREIRKMGGKIEVKRNGEIWVFPSKLSGSQIHAHDLRSAASLIIAGLIAEKSQTILSNFEIIYRGYERFASKLKNLGGKISILQEMYYKNVSNTY